MGDNIQQPPARSNDTGQGGMMNRPVPKPNPKKPIKRITPSRATGKLLYSNFLKDFPSMKVSRVIKRQLGYSNGPYNREHHPNVLARMKVVVKFWNTHVASSFVQRYHSRFPEVVRALAFTDKRDNISSYKEEDQTSFQYHIETHELAGIDTLKIIFYYVCSVIEDEEDEDGDEDEMERNIKKDRELIASALFRQFFIDLLLLCIYFSNKRENDQIIEPAFKNTDFFNVFPIDPYLEDVKSNRNNEDATATDENAEDGNDDYKKRNKPKVDTNN
jgi:hypothetical protein